MVVLFHYTFRAAADGKYSSVSFPELDNWTRYGFLGVDLFFIISGFVILLTVDAGRADQPTSCVTDLASLPRVLGSRDAHVHRLPERRPSVRSYRPRTISSTSGMLPSWLGAEYVDGVYWTLETELYFYLLVVGFLLAFWQRRPAGVVVAGMAAHHLAACTQRAGP